MADFNNLTIAEIMADNEPFEIAQELLKLRAKVSNETRMLDLLGYTQFATIGQLSRLYNKEDYLEGCKVLNLSIDAGLIGTIKNVKIKYGYHKGRSTTVYFLTAKGKKSLKVHLPKTARYAQSGFPDRISHSRINHQLLAAEAYLFYDSSFVIFKCENEDALKGEFQTKNEERRKAGLKRVKSNGGFPDLKIAFVRKDDDSGKVSAESIEACVDLSSRQIAAKSNDYDWFVFDESVAARIFDVKKEDATIADDILAPLEAEMFFRHGTGNRGEKKNKNHAETILEIIDALGGGTTSELVGLMTLLKATTLRIELEKLVAATILQKTVTSLIPGISRGRRCSFFYRPESNTDNDFIQRQTLRTYALTKVVDAGFTSFSANSYGAVILTNKETGKQAVLVTDFERSPNEWLNVARGNTPHPDEQEKIRATYEGRSIAYASYRLDLIEKVKKASPETHILDLGEDRQAQSYRFKKELSSDTITRDNRQRAD